MTSPTCPFPGMDPWLEQPGIWNDLHTRLITALADELAPRLRPRYTVVIEQRVYEDFNPPAPYIRPDASIVRERATPYQVDERVTPPVWVALSFNESVERYLEIRLPHNKQVITAIEILSPANKQPGAGREEYEKKRLRIVRSSTHLVEIDLLRWGQPMFMVGPPEASNPAYRILVSRAEKRPRSELYPFGIQDTIPVFKVPLLEADDDEPILHLTPLLHALYARASYDLQIDYTIPPIPPLPEEDQRWAEERLRQYTQIQAEQTPSL
jgi:hypothetical protein